MTQPEAAAPEQAPVPDATNTRIVAHGEGEPWGMFFFTESWELHLVLGIERHAVAERLAGLTPQSVDVFGHFLDKTVIVREAWGCEFDKPVMAMVRAFVRERQGQETQGG